MGGPHIDALRISPDYTSTDWFALNHADPADWSKATEMVRDRLEGRFLRYADNCLRSPYSGFVVLAIDSLVMETIQQFKEGDLHGTTGSRNLIKRFLSGPRFQPHFDEAARDAYYRDIRCGLLHQAEANRMWLVRRGEPAMLRQLPGGDGYVIDVKLMHKAVKLAFSDYLRDIRSTGHDQLRSHLWTKMNHISSVRNARGLEYEGTFK